MKIPESKSLKRLTQKKIKINHYCFFSFSNWNIESTVFNIRGVFRDFEGLFPPPQYLKNGNKKKMKKREKGKDERKKKKRRKEGKIHRFLFLNTPLFPILPKFALLFSKKSASILELVGQWMQKQNYFFFQG